MIQIHIPPTFREEREYVLHVLFTEFLGLEYHVITSTSNEVKIQIASQFLVLNDAFFGRIKNGDNYLLKEYIPKEVGTINHSFCIEKDLPVLYGSNELTVEKDSIYCGVDILASCFFMLTRWEEYVITARDFHGRFSGKDALSFHHKFLKRAIVNEYTELLWNMLVHFDPNLKRKKHKYELIPTHDIDVPLWGVNKNPLRWLRSVAADLLVRKDASLGSNRLISAVMNKTKNFRFDVANVYDFMMKTSETNGVKSRFYFIPDATYTKEDGQRFNLRHPFVSSLWSKILQRGHEIGIHPSYHSSRMQGKISTEKAELERILHETNIETKIEGGRQHYLRWEAPSTWQEWDDAELSYDSTLSYFDLTGFRCGTCYAFSVFNFLTKKRLSLKELPLIVMDCTAALEFGDEKKQLEGIKSLADTVKKFRGNMVILYHNTELMSGAQQAFYHTLLAAVK